MSLKTLISNSVDLREMNDKHIEIRVRDQLLMLTAPEFLDLCALVKAIEAYADFMSERVPQ